MKFNKKISASVIILLVTVTGISIYVNQTSKKSGDSTEIASASNPQCLKNANSLVTTQQKAADKEAAMTMMPDMQNMETEHVTVDLVKTAFNPKSHICLSQIHVVINKDNNTLQEEQIFAVYDNTSKDTILAQYSPSLKNKTNFIASPHSTKLKTNINESDLVSFAQGMGLN